MADQNPDEKLSIAGNEYRLSDLSNEAKSQIANINFVDERLHQLMNEWAILDTARSSYSNALKKELNLDED